MGRWHNRKEHELTRRQGEVLVFLTEWASEQGLTVKQLPPDPVMGGIIADAFGFNRQSGIQFLIQLRAMGCFGNTTDLRTALLNDQRIKTLCRCYQFLNKLHPHLKGNSKTTAAQLKTEILPII